MPDAILCNEKIGGFMAQMGGICCVCDSIFVVDAKLEASNTAKRKWEQREQNTKQRERVEARNNPPPHKGGRPLIKPCPNRGHT